MGSFICSIVVPPAKPMATLEYAGTTIVSMGLTLIIREFLVPEKLFIL